MQTLEAGSSVSARSAASRLSSGFTLLEMLIVVAIVAIASVGVMLSMGDADQARLESEAQRLTAILESARAQSRASGVPVLWRATPTGFSLEGLESSPQTPALQNWQASGISSSSAQALLLGPEPIIPAQSVRLWVSSAPERGVRIATDGARPFSVQSDNASPTP